MSRVLETVLTGRNMLSPVLASASRDITAFSTQVGTANERAALLAASSARAQTESAGRIVASNSRLAQSAQQTARIQSQAQLRSSAEIVASNSALQASVDRLIVATETLTVAQTTSSRSSQRVAGARAEETLATRANESAVRSLAGANALLGTSLSPLTAGLGAVGLGLAYAGYRGMEFDAAMSQVQAATQASASTMDDLRDAAIEQGAKTKYSAEEAAQGITEMAKAGVSTADIMGGGLAGALNLAAAGQISVSEAAETGATALSVFGLKGEQMTHIADLLAAGAGKAQGSVGDLSAALNQSALIAHQTGLSVEDTAGALAMFASNGLIGSDAGTSFKTMLQALTPNSVAASKAMEAIGFSAYDAQGNFVGLQDVAGQLQTGLSKLTVEQQNSTLKTIFGSDAIRAAAVLYTQGADGVAAWRDNVNDAGYAQRQAAQLTDNLRGDLERLGGAFDSVMTTIGGGAQDPLRELVQMLTSVIGVGGDVVGFLTSLPGPVLAGVAAFTALTLLRGPLSTLFAQLAVSITSTATGMGMATGATTAFGIATGVARAAVVSLITAAAPLAGMIAAAYVVKQIVDFAHAGDEATGSVQDLGEAIKAAEGNQARFQAVNTSLDDLKKKASEAQKVLDDYNNQSWFDQNVWKNPFGDNSEVIDAKKSVDAYEAAMDKLEAASTRADQSIDTLSKRYHVSRDEVIAFADAHNIDLTGSLDATDWAFTRLASSTGAFATQLGGVDLGSQNAYTSMAAYADALGLDEDATKDLIDKTNELGESLGEFVQPLGAYTGLLDEKKTAEQEAAQATADATDSATDSWEDYASDVSVSIDEYMAKLEEQLAAQTNWQTNMLLLAGRVSQGTIDELARMGPEGAPLVANLVNASDAELDRLDDITAARSKEATDAWGQQLTLAQPVLAAIGKTAGQGVVSELVAQLQAGTTTVADIAAQYGLNLAGGINPVLSGLGKAPISIGDGRYRTSGGAIQEADGGVLSFYANGGMRENHVAQHAPAGAMRIWAEPETGGETYIPHAPEKRGRSLDIWRETGKILNAPEAQYYANGGFVTAADVPKPSSTSPYGVPISTAGDAAMQKGFDEVTAWLKANTEATQGGTAGAGAVGGAWSSLWNLVKGQIPQARINSTYRSGDPGYHGRGKAIDFGFGSGPGGAGSAGLASINRLLHDQVGRNLAELIYDGIGDDRPDLKNGKPLTYNAATRAQHHNHVHAAVYHNGTDYVPQTGFAYLEKGEAVIPADRNPASMPGYGMTTGGGHGTGATKVSVSLAGATITGRFEFGSDGLITLVDGRIDGALDGIHDTVHYAGG